MTKSKKRSTKRRQHTRLSVSHTVGWPSLLGSGVRDRVREHTQLSNHYKQVTIIFMVGEVSLNARTVLPAPLLRQASLRPPQTTSQTRALSLTAHRRKSYQATLLSPSSCPFAASLVWASEGVRSPGVQYLKVCVGFSEVLGVLWHRGLGGGADRQRTILCCLRVCVYVRSAALRVGGGGPQS